MHGLFDMPEEPRREFPLCTDVRNELLLPRTKLIVLCSPGNPSGGVLTAEDLDKVAEIAQKCGAWVISDEIYSQLIFDGGRHETIATRPGMAERTVVLDGCSEAFAMTGWRVGFGLFPPSLVEQGFN